MKDYKMNKGQLINKNIIKQDNEEFIRTIISAVQDYFFESTKHSFDVGSPFIHKMQKSDSEGMIFLRIAFLGTQKATVLFRFGPKMLADFIKVTMHESVSYDDTNTVKELSFYMVQKMSKSIGKKLMNSMEDAYFKISSVKTLDESLLNRNHVVIPLHWKRHEISAQFII